MTITAQLNILIALKNPQESATILSNLSNRFNASYLIETEENALRKAQEIIPDFIIVEGSEGLDITKNIKAMPRCFTKCIVCFSAQDEGIIIHAIFANADAYFLKTTTNGAISECLSRLLGGERYITPAIANTILQSPKIDTYRKTIEKLSSREQEFFRLYGYHHSIKQIAALMFISENSKRPQKQNY